MKRSLKPVTFTLLIALIGGGRAQADLQESRLSSDEQIALVSMTPALAPECLAVVAALDGYRNDVQAARQLFVQAQTDNSVGQDAIAAAASKVVAIAKSLAGRSQAFRDLINFDDAVGKQLQSIEDQVNNAQFDPAADPAVTEADFRSQIRAMATAQAATTMVQGPLPAVFDLIIKAKNPAQYARGFLEDEIKAKYFRQPYQWGDVSISVDQQDFRKSLFSKDANITVRLEYDTFGSFAVAGVYFAYRDGELPEPMFDRVKAEGPDLTELAGKELSALGDLIPDVGLGIKLDPKFLGFSPDKRKRRCGIQCGVSIDGSQLLDFIPGLELKPKGTFTLYTTKPFVVTDDLDAKIVAADPQFFVQLGTTPVEMQGYTITIDPRPKSGDQFLSIKTNLGPSAGASNLVSLAVTISCGLPVRGFAFSGDLMLGSVGDGGEKIGSVDGKLNPAEFSGHFTIPPKVGNNLPIKAIIDASGQFKFDRDGLSSDASVLVYQIAGANSHLLLRPDGSGRVDFSESINFVGIKASGGVEATFEKRFSHLELVASLMISIGGLDSFGLANVSVITTIKDARSVTVQWSALGMSDTFVMSRDDNLIDELKKRLSALVPKAVQELFSAAKNLDVFNKNSALRLGMAQLDIFNKNTEAAKVLSQLGDVRNDFIKAIPGASEVSGGVQRFGDSISTGAKSLGLGLNTENDVPAGPSRVFFRALDHRSLSQAFLPYQITTVMAAGGGAGDSTAVVARAMAFVRALQKLDFHEHPPPERITSGPRRLFQQTELSVKCDRATLAPDGDHDIIIALSLRCSGYRVHMSSQEPSQRAQGAEIKWATVRLKNAQGSASGPRSIEINLPPLNVNHNYTDLDVSGLIHERLQAIIEQNLPDFSINGAQRFYEKHLAVHNASDEPINVWVQGRAFTRDQKGYSWRWLPGEPASGRALKFLVPARTTKKLDEDATIKIPRLSVSNAFKGGGVSASSASTIEHIPFEASRVRIWAETMSGDRQTHHRDNDCWLVPENPKLKGERVYVAPAMASATYSFSFPRHSRTFSERLVLLKNETHEHLTIYDLKYRTVRDGKEVWLSLPNVELQPGAVHRVTAADGSLVRASELRLLAQGEWILFDQHRDAALHLVQEHEGTRLYRADTIGMYEHVFIDIRNSTKNGK
jgi:hypothetical protein